MGKRTTNYNIEREVEQLRATQLDSERAVIMIAGIEFNRKKFIGSYYDQAWSIFFVFLHELSLFNNREEYQEYVLKTSKEIGELKAKMPTADRRKFDIKTKPYFFPTVMSINNPYDTARYKFHSWHSNTKLFGIRKDITDQFTIKTFTELGKLKGKMTKKEQKLFDTEIKPFIIPAIVDVEEAKMKELPSSNNQ